MDGEGQIAYEKKHAFHLSQLPAWINSYERINIIDQLMVMEVDKVVRISKDSIVCEPHEFPMHSYMEQKEVPSFANEPAERYCTNVWKPNPVVPMLDQFEDEFGGGDWGVAECAHLDELQHPRRTSYPVEAPLTD